MAKYYSILFCGSFFMFFSFCIAADEPIQEKPTREVVLDFVEKGENEPLTDEEKQLALSKRKLVDIAKQFGTDLTGLNLSGIDWGDFIYMRTRMISANGVNFSQCDFTDGQISYGHLNNCRFDNADLTNATFYSCKFNNTDFSNARLRQTQFYWSSFKHSNFSHLKLQNCKLWGCEFSNADVSGTDFSGTEFYTYRNDFQSANCTDSRFTGLDLQYADFRNACLKNADFSNTKLYKANFTGANLEGTDFTNANLYAADFSDVTGIDNDARKKLESRTMMWLYDFTVSFWKFLTDIYYPCCYLCLPCVILFSALGLLKKEWSKFFIWAVVLNTAALLPTLGTIMLMFSDGHQVRQLSGNMDVWSAWLHAFLFLALDILFVTGTSIILLFVFIVVCLLRKKIICRRFTFFYLILTVIHTCLAFSWLMLFMPDA